MCVCVCVSMAIGAFADLTRYGDTGVQVFKNLKRFSEKKVESRRASVCALAYVCSVCVCVWIALISSEAS